ncbi:MAG TPA: anti-sigma factor [Acidobacteriaceae bacterium]|nr:anti-sigma factor [Acidobacteriaceae bacterium]
MTGNGHNTQEELASYAMQALSVEESASIRAHLQACAACRAELAKVSGDLALLGLAVEQQSLPEGARDRFLQRIAAAPAAKSEEKMADVTPITAKTSRRGKGFWIPWGAAAALAAVCIGLGVQNRALNDELDDETKLVKNLAAQASKAQQVLEVLTAPSAQRVVLTEGNTPPEPTARATYLPERGGLILFATNLKPLPQDRTYELWVIPANGSAPVPAGLFRPDARGSATLVLPQLSPGITAKALAVTVEKASGSDTPTMPIVLSGATTGS